MSINRKFTKILRRLVMSHKMSVNCALSSGVSCPSYQMFLDLYALFTMILSVEYLLPN